MADVSALKAKVERWAERVHASAVADGMLRRLDDAVPRGDGPRDGRLPLAETRIVEQVGPLAATVAYPGPVPVILNAGSGPHRITGNPVLRFVWPAGPSRGVKPSKGSVGTYFFRSVEHPGSTKWQGWWDRVMTAENWRRALDDAARSTPF